MNEIADRIEAGFMTLVPLVQRGIDIQVGCGCGGAGGRTMRMCPSWPVYKWIGCRNDVPGRGLRG